MLRGLLSGGILGVVVGGASLTVASLMAEQPAGNTPPAAPQVSAPETTQVDAPTSNGPQDVAPTMIAPDIEGVTTPTVSMPDVGTDPTLADTASADVPQASNVSEALVAPDSTPALSVDATAEEPVLPNPQSVAPQVPVSEQDITVSTTPAALPDPVIVAVDDPIPATTLNIPVPQPRLADVLVIDTPIVEPQPAPPTEDASAQDIATAPASSLPTGDTSVQVNRITTEESVVADPETEPAVDPSAPALVRYGTVFENVDSKPLIGIILLDDGSMNGASAAVASLPFDVTVVIDLAVEGAAERLEDYRAAGIEVGVQSALPLNATPTDVEIALEATFAKLPQTVLLLDAGDGGLQNDRAVTEQAMAVLAEDGRGLVTVSKGLNMALRAAQQADVPAGVIFRDLDAEGQDARVIRRFLDQAAFRARQESGVLLLARVRPNTISALVLWGTANRAGQVAVAPVSEVLSAQD
ncbi:MAG: polysaccharide deacetylase 2 family uncharacterized protein YibQ [Reinekea sp.]